MPAHHERRSRPYDPEDRDRLDRLAKPRIVMTPGTLGPRGMVFMQGDLGRILKIFVVLGCLFISGVRFTTATPIPLFFVALAAVAATVAAWASLIATLRTLDFVRANEFLNPDHFIRRAKSLHIAEVAAAAVWIIWLGFSFGRIDWIPIAIAVVVAVFAFIQRSRVAKISQPRNMWEK